MLPVDHEITSSTGGGHLFAKHRGWGSLANELRVHILQELDVTDLLSCTKVARVFKTLINDTPSLRYRLLLHAAGMRAGPRGGLSVLKRIALLEEYEKSWKAGNIPICQRPSGDYEAGGVFMTLGRDQCQLDVRRPASFFSGVPEKAWTINLSELPEQGNAEFDPSSRFAVDLAQDLLVLMELPVHDPEKYPKCYVLSLSGKGATHPLAARGEIYCGSSLGLSSPEANVEIVGDLVGCTVLGMDIYMSVYNWKTGIPLWFNSEWDGDFNEMAYHTRCHILDSTHVLKISKYDLTVYSMAANFGTSTTGELAWHLGMPALAEGFKATYRASYIQRPRETPDCSPHFECDPSVTVLVVKYDIYHESHRRQDRTMLIAVIPISTMLARARVPPTTPKISHGKTEEPSGLVSPSCPRGRAITSTLTRLGRVSSSPSLV
ncbi:hypothetical protein K466DRAFT_660756 [Polyporus arcularius HHB13444]|uniref:F-box domain-containing protein n=1 Tax=Polyporus arcularius HHB13444 TaxID=1314778 RepID=A0A5C3PWM0_9APHY|nr:hypothetical protein K466DRAFT_660756 [Polyporus arcularius HHB13444]